MKEYFLSLIDNNAKIVEYLPNQTIVNAGEVMDSLLIMIEGKGKVIQQFENGKNLLFQFLKPINLLGDVEYVCEVHIATCTVIATTVCKFAKISFKELDQNYHNDLEFNQRLLKYTSSKLLQSSSKNALNSVYDVRTKLASYILSTESDDELYIYNVEELSEYIGTSYRHLNRTLKDFEANHIIKRKNRKILIIDKKTLEMLSRGNVYEID